MGKKNQPNKHQTSISKPTLSVQTLEHNIFSAAQSWLIMIRDEMTIFLKHTDYLMKQEQFLT